MSSPGPQLYRDPWAKREAWRKHPIFSSRSLLKSAFPGLGIAIVAFSVYVFVDNMYQSGKTQKSH